MRIKVVRGADRAEPPDPGARQRLLAAATQLFTSRGYAAAPVREIVERAGVAKPALYYHFGSKEGIYRALFDQLLGDFEKRLATPSELRGTPWERIVRLTTDLFEFVKAHLDTVRFFYAVYYGPPQGAPFVDFDVFPRRLEAALGEALQEGITAGHLRRANVEYMNLAIQAALSMAVELALCQPERRFSSADLTRLLELIFTGLAPARAAKPARGVPERVTQRPRKEPHR